MIVPALLNSLIFFGLGLIHFYWALGGKLAFAEALPRNESGKRVLNPSPMSSVIVGMGLLLFSACYLLKLGWIAFSVHSSILSIIGWAVAPVFLLRAIGDFRYVGFFKKIKKTDFAIRDTRYYSPLCLLLSINATFVELL